MALPQLLNRLEEVVPSGFIGMWLSLIHIWAPAPQPPVRHGRAVQHPVGRPPDAGPLVARGMGRPELARLYQMCIRDSAPSLLSATYTDNAAGKADEVRLDLHDRDGKWLGEWAPKKGTEVSMRILCTDWFGPGQDASLNCGSFKVDEVEYSGPPTKVSIKAVSAALTDGLRETKKTQAGEGYSLRAVAGEIAQRNGLELLYNADAFPFNRQDQREESDLPFLQRLASARGVNVKVHDGRLVCEAAKRGDARAAAVAISRTCLLDTS